MNLNKVASAVLALVMGAAALAGCSGEKQTTADNKPVIRQLSPYISDDYNTYPVAQVIEDLTGYHVEYDMLPQDKWEDKLNLILSSGEDNYDSITIRGAGKSRYVDLANQGALTDITDLLEEYGPNIIEMVGRDMLDSAKVNGRIYGIPSGGGADPELPIIDTTLAYRKDLIDAAGIKLPQTTEEFREFLKEIKDKNLTGNERGSIPLVLSSSDYNINSLTGAFGVSAEIIEKDGTVWNRVELPQYKEYLQYMNSLYSEGLIDTEFPTNKTTTVNEKITSGKAVVMPFGWVDSSTIMSAIKETDQNAEIEFMTPPQGPDGNQGYDCYVGGLGWDLITFIPATCKNPEEVIKFYNEKLDKETFKKITLGDENVHYTVNEKGEYYPILPKFFDERSKSNFYTAGIDRENYPKYWLARLRKDEVMYNTFCKLNGGELDKYKSVKKGLTGMPLSAESAKNLQSMKQIVSDYAVKFICGTESFDNYDKFVNEWKEAGGEQYMKEYREWYESKEK
ncbi:MAG: extracellular solute-binding protein [Clostridia bacterium]|nr:extracellular solute-binding protein [Clostridia bacterium]